VSISCDPNFTFSIDDHVMTVIEVDGTNVKPLRVDSIQIFAGKPLPGYYPYFSHTYVKKGQRYSFVVS
jgi:multicopper oxidase